MGEIADQSRLKVIADNFFDVDFEQKLLQTERREWLS